MLSWPFKRRSHIACIDLGSYQVRALVASVHESGAVEVLGYGAQRSEGISHGLIHDMAAASTHLSDALAIAESQAGVKAQDVFLSLSPHSLASFLLDFDIEVPEGRVAPHHLHQAEISARAAVAEQRPDLAILHAIPVGFELDGLGQTANPCDQSAHALSATYHLVAAPQAVVSNVLRVCEHARLNLRALVAAPYATALASLSADQRQLGCALLDLGGETSSLALFHQGKLVHTSVLPLGGQHMTRHIADALQIRLDEAEERKVRRAQLTHGPNRQGQAEPQSAPDLFNDPLDGSEVSEICASAHAQILERVAAKLKHPNLTRFAPRTVVLSGGGAMIQGLRFFAEDYLPGYRLDLHRTSNQGQGQGFRYQSSFAATMGLLDFAGASLKRRSVSRGSRAFAATPGLVMRA